MVGHLGGALRSDVGLPSRLGFGDLAAMIKTTLAHHQMVGLMWLVVVLLVGQGSPSTGLCDGGVGVGDCDAPPTGDPYAILGVGRRAEKEAIVKATEFWRVGGIPTKTESGQKCSPRSRRLTRC